MIEVRPLTDPQAINRILADPWIGPKIGHDGRAPVYIEHPLLSYHGAWVADRLAGLFIAVAFTRWEVEVHAAIHRWALPRARQLAAVFLDGVFEAPDVQRATAYVLSDIPSAANYCRRLGFHDEGVRRNAAVKDGKVLDLIVLGLLRSEWIGTQWRHRERHGPKALRPQRVGSPIRSS